MGVVWMLSYSALRPNHKKNLPNEFVANFLSDNMGSKKNKPPTSEQMMSFSVLTSDSKNTVTISSVQYDS